MLKTEDLVDELNKFQKLLPKLDKIMQNILTFMKF